jgi:diguanylate cyclase (GGDEF)-like protein/PAS domain S-box-containing protein
VAQRFSSLVDVQKVQQLLDRLYDATGIPSGIIEVDSTIISATGWQDICTKFHRACEQSRQNCLESDRIIAEHLHTKAYVGYQCKNGLLEYACPIMIEGKHLATLFIGQFFIEQPDLAYFREQARCYGYPEEAYLAALAKVPVFSEQKVAFIMNFFVALADLLSCSGAHSLKYLESANFLQEVLNAMPSPIFYKDMEGKYIGCNQAFAAFVGKQPSEIIGKSVYDVFPYIAADKYSEMDQDLLSNPGIQVYEYRMSDATGQHHDVLFNKALFKDINGAVAGLVGAVIDITARKQMEAALQRSEAKYRALFEHMLNGFIYLKAEKNPAGEIVDYRLLECNDAFVTTTGLAREMIIGRTMSESVFANITAGVNWQGIFNSVLESGEAHTFEYCSPRLNKWYLTSVFTPNEDYVAALFSDITTRKQNEERTEYYAYHDPLTGLPNRRLFEDRLAVALSQAQRNEEWVAVLFLDLDNFKPINDTYGHEAGDQLLRQVAQRMRNCIRSCDTVARLGGDEFVIILPGTNTRQEIETIATRILVASRDPIVIDQDEIVITMSIGISIYPKDGTDITSLMRNADVAMFMSKRHGRNRISFVIDAANFSEGL